MPEYPGVCAFCGVLQCAACILQNVMAYCRVYVVVVMGAHALMPEYPGVCCGMLRHVAVCCMYVAECYGVLPCVNDCSVMARCHA